MHLIDGVCRGIVVTCRLTRVLEADRRVIRRAHALVLGLLQEQRSPLNLISRVPLLRLLYELLHCVEHLNASSILVVEMLHAHAHKEQRGEC